MDFGTAFVQGVSDMLSGVANWFTSIFATIGGILYTPGVGEASGSLTIVGWIITIVVALTVVGFGIKFVMGLISKIKAK